MPSSASVPEDTTSSPSRSSTSPVTGTVEVTVTSTSPAVPYTIGAAVAPVVDTARVTSTVTVVCDGALFASPRYRTVSRWMAGGSAVPGTSRVAVPSSASVAVSITASPSSSSTSPVTGTVEVTAASTWPAVP